MMKNSKLVVFVVVLILQQQFCVGLWGRNDPYSILGVKRDASSQVCCCGMRVVVLFVGGGGVVVCWYL